LKSFLFAGFPLSRLSEKFFSERSDLLEKFSPFSVRDVLFLLSKGGSSFRFEDENRLEDGDSFELFPVFPLLLNDFPEFRFGLSDEEVSLFVDLGELPDVLPAPLR
jgi:hypothetical protein